MEVMNNPIIIHFKPLSELNIVWEIPIGVTLVDLLAILRTALGRKVIGSNEAKSEPFHCTVEWNVRHRTNSEN